MCVIVLGLESEGERVTFKTGTSRLEVEICCREAVDKLSWGGIIASVEVCYVK